ncbi:hypothetical protein BD626DRAFT_501615 [Schizophyllum amplum]|uniref:F-box domain-containing protein n=1 Tax=Schizophyllum amplum TaxID=97359 RepID=A0A550C9X8_9AGAR|nr:hypothetical protein BD626DRAFT_501615 [Auriculariopsis ampla]
MADEEKLPQELKEAILSHIFAQRDLQSLVACALAHRSLRYASQAYLFRDIQLHMGMPTATKLRRALHDAPHLRAYVRVLRLEERSRSDQWIYREDSLSDILEMLEDLQELYLHPSSVYYGAIPEATRAALAKVLALPSLRTLSLACMIELPLSILTHLTQLRDLRLAWTMHNSQETLPALPGTVTERVALSSLTLCLNEPSFAIVGMQLLEHGKGLPFRIDSLRSLRLYVYHRGWHQKARSIIGQCASTLQSLELGLAPVVHGIAEDMFHISFEALPRLKLLALRIAVDNSSLGLALIPTWLVDFLATAKDITHLAINLRSDSVFYLSALLPRLGKMLALEYTSPALKSAEKVEVTLELAEDDADVQPPLLGLELLDE